MKKMVLGAGCWVLGAMCLAAQGAETVFVGQSIGSIEVQGTGTNTIVAVAFKELSAKDEFVSVANIISSEDLNVGDIVCVYHNGGYESWTLAVDGQGVKYWEKNEKKIALNAEGEDEMTDGPDADTVRPPIGSGFCLRHVGEKYPFTFHIFGAYLEPSTTTAAAAVEGKSTKTLMGNPGMVAKAPTIANMVTGDIVQFITPSGASKVYTYNSAKARWSYWNENNKVVWVDAPEVPAGIGFWYVANGDKDVSFNWQ